MTVVRELGQLSAAIDRAYRSRHDPRFDFVDADRARKQYAAVLKELATHFTITDTTDENDDVSLVLALQHDSKTWALYLSMVGRFAALVRIQGKGGEFVDRDNSDASVDEQILMTVLDKHAVRAIAPALMFKSVSMRTDPDEKFAPNVFGLLFSTTDPFPNP